MSDPLVYDSRSVRFKSPYGAVPSGTQVTFTLRPLRSEGYSRGKLTARLEQRDNQIITVELPWTDTELGRDAFSGVLDTGTMWDWCGTPFSWRPSPVGAGT